MPSEKLNPPVVHTPAPESIFLELCSRHYLIPTIVEDCPRLEQLLLNISKMKKEVFVVYLALEDNVNHSVLIGRGLDHVLLLCGNFLWTVQSLYLIMYFVSLYITITNNIYNSTGISLGLLDDDDTVKQVTLWTDKITTI
ncbi:hypothetical protein BDA99DRAFT_543197 [Phascolomyces articulosus]|uniref:Uncharacterized protein n=1 Tax=Phascolomyces articulosus TaxID=60185 RepID=A0AAD5JYH0_9FUNG|nr:hypothetical protein BDA99DRAFT_543197 [Phascolomyces articulosus]